MNLFEAKRIAERNGYKVIKESEDKTVPPWAKKKAMLKEAREIVERAGYTVVSERYGNDDGDVLTKILEPYNRDGMFLELVKLKGLDTVKQEIANKLADAIGSGIGPKWYNKFKVIWPTKKNPVDAAKYLYDCWLKSMCHGAI